MIHRKYSYLIYLLLTLCTLTNLNAQDFTNAQRREINLKVYSLLANYTRYGKFSSNYSSINENYVYEFAALFDSTAVLYNDILPDNERKLWLSVEDYVKLIRKHYPHGFGFKLDHIQFGIPARVSDKDSTYRMLVGVKKEITGTTSRNKGFKGTRDLDFILLFNVLNGEVSDLRIDSLNATPQGSTIKLLYLDKKDRPVTDLEIAFLRTPNRNFRPGESEALESEISDTLVNTDRDGRIVLNGLAPFQEYRYTVDAEEYSIISEPFYVTDFLQSIPDRTDREYFDPNELITTLRPSRLMIGLFFAPSITGKNIRFQGYDDFRSDSTSWYNDSYKRAQDFYLGLRLGYKLLYTSSLDLYILTGIEMSRFSGKITADGYETRFQAFDGAEDYVRLVALSNFSQTIRASGINIPLHLFFKIRKKKNISINVEAGANLNMFTNHTYDVQKGEQVKGTYLGLYEQYLDLIIDEDPGFGFGTSEYAEGNRDWEGQSMAVSFYISPTISKWITKKTEIYFGPVFNYGFKDISSKPNRIPLSFEMEEFNSITDVAEEVRFGAISLELGMRYRFANLSSIKKFPH